MIVKIQRPLMTNGDEPMALIYDRTKEFTSFVPLAWVESLFDVNDVKIYADVNFREDGQLEVLDVLDCQDF